MSGPVNLITMEEYDRMIGRGPKSYPNEKAFDTDIVRFCKELNLLTYHTYSSRKSEPGFPDRIILLPDWLYVLELKVDAKPTVDQLVWIAAFSRLPNCTAKVLYPKDWPAIAADIYRRRRPAAGTKTAGVASHHPAMTPETLEVSSAGTF